jgi:hypothetical protein
MTVPEASMDEDDFPRFAGVIRQLSPQQVENPRSVADLRLADVTIGGRVVEMVYAPFDHANTSARIAVVGLTPGRQQAANALGAAQQALLEGSSNEQAGQRAKVFASFSGPMRANLIAMLDKIGIARWLGITTTASLWDRDSQLIHFTSALRYPVFLDGENWSGTPDMLRIACMRNWLDTYTGTELSLLQDAVFVPLGPKVSAALNHLADIGRIPRDRILDGMPHPSGANAERIAYFLGNKASADLSPKTNPDWIDAARANLLGRVAAL